MSSVNLAVEGPVAVIELSRPEVMNAIDLDMRRLLLDVLQGVARDGAIRAVVLTGAGKGFCAGADLKAAAQIADPSPRRTARTLLHDVQPAIECIARMDKPVIAAVNGPAIGVGIAFALAADLMVMARGSYLLSSFSNIGLIADGGAAWFLVRKLGHVRALEVMLQAEKLAADQCLSLGLANRVVDDARADAVAWAGELAKRAPLAVAATKRMARMAMSSGLSEVMAIEAELQTFLAVSEDTKEAIKAFGEKRVPEFRGR